MGARAHVYVLRVLALLMCSLLKYLWNKPYKQSDSCDALGFRNERFPGIQSLLYRLDDQFVKGSVRRRFNGGPMNSVWRRFDILRHFEWIKLKMSSWWGGTGRNCFQALPVVISRSKVILYLAYASRVVRCTHTERKRHLVVRTQWVDSSRQIVSREVDFKDRRAISNI